MKSITEAMADGADEFDISELSEADQRRLYGEALVQRFARFSPGLALRLEDLECQ